MAKDFGEATRVQMPALVHLTRLGYKYFGKITEEDANIKYDPDTNILIQVFRQQFNKLNPKKEGEFEQIFRTIKQELDYDDIGKSFYKRLISTSPIRLIDFENPDNNVFHCTIEFTCKRDNEEFRPDITLFVNGLPLCFIEVKKPNNIGGIIAESDRMTNQRFPNRKFRRFINITQLMIFSNNMEYDTLGGLVPVQGAFYCTGSKKKAYFNCFREENKLNEPIAPYNKNYPYLDINPIIEKQILSDFNCQVIHTAPEYQSNLNINTPTNRIITSMCSKKRLLFLIKYGIAYVNDNREIDGQIVNIEQKHIMRYQQMFAALAIRDKIDKGMTSGVLWHTQGSGKTALAYYLNYVLTDYFALHNKVAKFYFIVDRLDLLEQASQEFKARGLIVKTANSRKELMEQFRSNQSLEGASGGNEVVVVNIQRFAEDHEKVNLPNYGTNLQRVFIIDEAHRGYKPEGSFLGNLFEADKNAVKIALTGTPLLKEERASWKIFGNYYHTYYYDKSIEDGYTLKVIREPIETSYKDRLSEIYEKLETLVQKKDVKRSDIIEHDTYVKELLRYIITDLSRFRMIQGDDTLGGMVIAETSEQARKLYQFFNEIQDELILNKIIKKKIVAGLILHDSDDKETRERIITNFKKNFTVDILIVFNMLLTGFDAPRLKRLYFGRKLKDHNLLQAITRVNRPYRNHKYGYVIDFADIRQNFDKTNAAYIRELSKFNDPNEVGEGNTIDTFTQILESSEKLIEQIKEARNVVFNFTTDNAEEFSNEISQIEDKDKLIEIRKALTTIRDCFNLGRTFGDEALKTELKKLEIVKLPYLISEVQHHIDNINQKIAISTSDSTKQIINEAMADITFKFTPKADEELQIIDGADHLIDKIYNDTIKEFCQNHDQDDPEYITLRQALLEKFKEHKFVVQSKDDYEAQLKLYHEFINKLKELEKRNYFLAKKYNGDFKFARIHKRILEHNRVQHAQKNKLVISKFEEDIVSVLNKIKSTIDQKVYDRNDILKKDAYFSQTVMQLINQCLDDLNMSSTREDRLFIQQCISKQYLLQYRETYPN